MLQFTTSSGQNIWAAQATLRAAYLKLDAVGALGKCPTKYGVLRPVEFMLA